MRKKKGLYGILLTLLLAVGVFAAAALVKAEPMSYDRDASLIDDGKHPGVYRAKAVPGDNKATMGIPSIAKQNLEGGPTTESPAIIMGAAVPYEVKTGPTEFTVIPDGSLYAPYSYFRYKIIEEANQGGTGGTHRKMSGFDGSYVIIRVDVSELIKDAPEGSYLHVKQEGNKALMVQLAYDEKENAKSGVVTFSDALGNKAGVYSLDNNAAALKDTDGNDQDNAYVDVVIYSSGTLIAGADTGSTDPNIIGADFTLKMYVDQTADYNPGLKYDPQSTDTNHATNVMAKYYDESKVSADAVSSYVVKGSDLELEVTNDDGPRAAAPEFWSMRKAMTWGNYNNSPIKMICEVPVLEGLLVDDAGMTDRHVILDVNSFDIQIANHQTTGAAGLTVKDATLTLQDSFNTTGAELAVGNNATMSIQSGGKLIVTDTCQLEVEYDAASTTTAEGETPAAPTTYDCGVISIENGGEIVNNGVITIEGTEGKPLDPANPSVRDVKNAEFHIRAGGKLTNNGCLLSYGSFFNMGTIVNNGKYADVIQSNDPDKGSFTYHKGIQISWKDDVTQDNITMGSLYNGLEGETKNTAAQIVNTGDIVLVPGILENYGVLENQAEGAIYACSVEEAVIPITPTIDAPTIVEKRIRFGNPVAGWVGNYEGGTLNNAGTIAAAKVEIVNNGRTGALTTEGLEEDIDENISLYNFGTASNSGDISVSAGYTFGEMTNTGKIQKKVAVSKNSTMEGKLTDSAEVKLDNVYNAKKTVEGDSNIWTYTTIPALNVSPATQECAGYEKPVWKVKAELNTDAEGLLYEIAVIQAAPGESRIVKRVSAALNEEIEIVGPEVPNINGNVEYSFFVDGNETDSVTVTVKVTAAEITPPTAKEDLVYNGTDLVLTTTGAAGEGSLQYRLGKDGEWTDTVPAAKDAGTYSVYYKLASAETEAGLVEATIAKRPATVSADDAASMAGSELKELTYSVSGLAGSDSIGNVTITTDADKDTAGKYSISVSVEEANPNYEITLIPGTYNVTESDFVVTAKDKYGVFSDDAAYKGFNIELTAPEGAKIYYSTDQALDSSNYETAGTESSLFSQPAGAGTYTVYYYVVSADGANSASGSKQVIIEKASQKAPTGLEVKNESFRNAGDGQITGLKPREMEYRRSDDDGTYQTAYYTYINAAAGTYLIRMIGDKNHYAGEDTEVTVEEGPPITIEFDSNGGTEVAPVTDLSAGDVLQRPADPVKFGFTFDGWYAGESDEAYDFSKIVSWSFALTAHWKAIDDAQIILPAPTKVIGESAFEGASMKAVKIRTECETIGKWAFKDCLQLSQIRIPANVTKIDDTAFEGCSGVVVFGAGEESKRIAELYNFTYVEE